MFKTIVGTYEEWGQDEYRFVSLRGVLIIPKSHLREELDNLKSSLRQNS